MTCFFLMFFLWLKTFLVFLTYIVGNLAQKKHIDTSFTTYRGCGHIDIV